MVPFWGTLRITSCTRKALPPGSQLMRWVLIQSATLRTMPMVG